MLKVTAIREDWSEIVKLGLENQQIDFKSHQNWNDIGRVGRAKFARHAMALANTQGGYVVVGVTENSDGVPNIFTGMTEEEASSFDPSNVGQTINTFADPPVSLDIVRPVVEGKRYVIFVVYPFTDIPHVCTENCERELSHGGFYVRTPDARSKLADRASEIHPLVRRALRNQRQMLGRMLRGILYEDKVIEPSADEQARPLLESSRRHALKYLGGQIMQSQPCFEVSAFSGKSLQDVHLADLRNAYEQLERPTFADIPWSQKLIATSEAFATNDSLCGVVKVKNAPIAFWEVYCNGFFYIALAIASQEQPEIHGGDLAHGILLSLAALGEFYSLLNHPDGLLEINMRVLNANNAALSRIPFVEDAGNHICHIPEIQVSCQRSPADLEGGASAESAVKLFAEICERFNVFLKDTTTLELRREFDQIIS